jgi:hypothetical protein
MVSGAQSTRPLAVSEKHATIVVGYAMRMEGLPSGDARLLMLYSDSGAVIHTTIYMSPRGEIIAYRGDAGAELGRTGTGVLSAANTWYYLEMKCVLHDTTGEIKVNVNGVNKLNLTNKDTKNAGTESVYSFIRIYSPFTSAYFDDMYIMNGAGSVNNDIVGECRVRTIRPNGNGTTSGMTGSDGNSTDNYLLVDETVFSTGTADYVESSVDNTKDTYAFEDLPESTGTIIGVQYSAYAQKSDAAARSFAFVTRSGGSESDGADTTLSTGFATYTLLLEQNPVTSTAWTISSVNGAEFGVKVRP